MAKVNCCQFRSNTKESLDVKIIQEEIKNCKPSEIITIEVWDLSQIHARLNKHQENGCRQHQPACFSKVVNR